MAEMRSVQDEKRGKEINIKLSIINVSPHKLCKKGGVLIKRRELIMIFIYINDHAGSYNSNLNKKKVIGLHPNFYLVIDALKIKENLQVSYLYIYFYH